jgi:hypothetical protein
MQEQCNMVEPWNWNYLGIWRYRLVLSSSSSSRMSCKNHDKLSVEENIQVDIRMNTLSMQRCILGKILNILAMYFTHFNYWVIEPEIKLAKFTHLLHIQNFLVPFSSMQ